MTACSSAQAQVNTTENSDTSSLMPIQENPLVCNGQRTSSECARKSLLQSGVITNSEDVVLVQLKTLV
jgi:hypothetical protein